MKPYVLCSIRANLQVDLRQKKKTTWQSNFLANRQWAPTRSVLQSKRRLRLIHAELYARAPLSVRPEGIFFCQSQRPFGQNV